MGHRLTEADQTACNAVVEHVTVTAARGVASIHRQHRAADERELAHALSEVIRLERSIAMRTEVIRQLDQRR